MNLFVRHQKPKSQRCHHQAVLSLSSPSRRYLLASLTSLLQFALILSFPRFSLNLWRSRSFALRQTLRVFGMSVGRICSFFPRLRLPSHCYTLSGRLGSSCSAGRDEICLVLGFLSIVPCLVGARYAGHNTSSIHLHISCRLQEK